MNGKKLSSIFLILTLIFSSISIKAETDYESMAYTEYQIAKEKVTDKMKEISNLQTDILRLEFELKDLKALLEMAKNNSEVENNKKIEQLKTQIAAYDREIQNLESEITAKKADLNNLEREISEARATIEEKNGQLTAKQEAKTAVESEVAKLETTNFEQEINNSETKIQALTTEIENLEREKTDLESRKAQIAEENKARNQEIETKNNQLNSLNSELAAIKNSIQEKTAQISKIENQIAAKERELNANSCDNNYPTSNIRLQFSSDYINNLTKLHSLTRGTDEYNSVKAALDVESARLKELNENNPVPTDTDSDVNISNISEAQVIELSEFAAGILNNVREQFSTIKYTVVNGSVAFAKAVGNNYQREGFNIFEHRMHYARGINDAARALGLAVSTPEQEAVGAQYYENIAAVTKPRQTRLNLSDLKRNIYDSIVGFLFEDGGQDYGHALALVGLDGKPDYSSTEQNVEYIGVSFSDVIMDDTRSALQAHFIQLRKSFIPTGNTTFDQSPVHECNQDETAKARLRQEISDLTNQKNTINGEKTNLENNLGAKETEISSLTSEIATLRSQNSDDSAIVRDIEAKTALINVKNIEKTETETKLQELRNQKANKDQLLTEKRQELATINSDINRLTSEIEAINLTEKLNQKTQLEQEIQAKQDLKANNFALRAEAQRKLAALESLNNLSVADIERDIVNKEANLKATKLLLDHARRDLVRLQDDAKAKYDRYLKTNNPSRDYSSSYIPEIRIDRIDKTTPEKVVVVKEVVKESPKSTVSPQVKKTEDKKKTEKVQDTKKTETPKVEKKTEEKKEVKKAEVVTTKTAENNQNFNNKMMFVAGAVVIGILLLLLLIILLKRKKDED